MVKLNNNRNKMTTKIMLISCGSFNPPTPMHLRMFEIAKDYFTELGTHEVIGGIVSPVHDAYGKSGLLSQTHRVAMVKLALKTSSWINISEWETQQEEWTPTRATLQYHQNYLNSIVRDLNGINCSNLPSWIPENVKQTKDPAKLMLLCGADLLESFATPGLWKTEDLEAILGQHGLVVITRNGSNPERFIFNSDLLSKHRRSIHIVTNWVPNEISSTLARRFLSRKLSVKYLLDDSVIEYINKHELYHAPSNEETKFILPPSNNTSCSTVLLTPISPESENSTTFNESYVKIQNDRNESPVADDYESMDETDFPPPPPPLKTSSLTVDYISGTNSLQKVFCCASADGTSVRLTRPGMAVQIHSDGSEKTDKVGDTDDSNSTIENHIINNPSDDDFGTNDNAPTPSPTSPAQIESSSAREDCDEEQSDSESLTSSLPKTYGRFSPKTYNEMIKFVFTEHGIRVISDKEYVV